MFVFNSYYNMYNHALSQMRRINLTSQRNQYKCTSLFGASTFLTGDHRYDKHWPKKVVMNVKFRNLRL